MTISCSLNAENNTFEQAALTSFPLILPSFTPPLFTANPVSACTPNQHTASPTRQARPGADRQPNKSTSNHTASSQTKATRKLPAFRRPFLPLYPAPYCFRAGLAFFVAPLPPTVASSRNRFSIPSPIPFTFFSSSTLLKLPF